MKAKYVWRFKLELRRTEIWIYRQKKQKGKISLKTLIMFLINLIFYAMVTGTNYHRTHPGESKFQAGITYNNVRIFIYSIVFCLGLAIMKKMKKLASKWIITWAILCTVFLIVMSFCEIENAYVSFSTADQAEKYYGIEKNKICFQILPSVIRVECDVFFLCNAIPIVCYTPFCCKLYKRMFHAK